MSKLFLRCVILLLSFSLAVLSGCGRSRFAIKELGFSIQPPKGWKQGEPELAGGFKMVKNGRYFFESSDNDEVFISVYDFPSGGKPLTQYVDESLQQLEKIESLWFSMGKGLAKIAPKVFSMTEEEEVRLLQEAEDFPKTRVLSRRERKISSLDAVELVLETESFKSIETYFIRKGEIIQVICQAPVRDFAGYETGFRTALDSIQVKL